MGQGYTDNFQFNERIAGVEHIFMVRLILIRHGVTKWNRDRRYCGSRDIDLSNEGRSQVKLLSDKLNAGMVDKVYCSHKKRAIQTARILFKQANIIQKRGLREIDFGALEGLRHEEIIVKYSSAYDKWLKDPFTNNIPRAEPMSGFEKRVESALLNIVRSNSGNTVAVVCHGGVIGIFLTGALKNKNFWRCVPSPASVTVVEHRNGKFELKKFNDTAHLKVNYE